MRQEKTLKPVGNFIITEAPSCVLSQMGNNEKAVMWVANDFSDGEPVLDKLAARFQNVEAVAEFRKAFEAAQKFNEDAKAGKEDLVFADEVEDIDEKEEDDIDTNKTADKDGE